MLVTSVDCGRYSFRQHSGNMHCMPCWRQFWRWQSNGKTPHKILRARDHSMGAFKMPPKNSRPRESNNCTYSVWASREGQVWFWKESIGWLVFFLTNKMRCKICGKTVKSGQAVKAHCWTRSQQCSKCHYIGMTYHRSFKFDLTND